MSFRRCLHPLRAVAKRTLRVPIAMPVVNHRALAFTPLSQRTLFTSRVRFAAEPSSAAPSRAEIESRVLEAIRKFDKVDAAKVTGAITFKDLGLDSLDGVELVMAFEDEFGVEISDADAEKITSAQTAVDYLVQHPQVK